MEKQVSASWLRNATAKISSSLRPDPLNRPFPVNRPFLIEESGQLADPVQQHAQALHEIFQGVAHVNPLSVALTFRGEDISYKELNRRANRVAHRLINLGVGPESPVGLAIGRSAEFIIGVLAIVKAGGAYVPLDPTYPRERLNYMLGDVHPDVVLTAEDEIDVDAPWARTVRVTADVSDFAMESEENPETEVGPRNAAYVMYTSGSTGNPKGVVIEQRSIIRLVCEPDYITISPLDTFLQLSPTSFDASTLEIWGALLNGARLVIMPSGPPSLQNIGRMVEQEQVTTLWLTAGLFHAMIDEQLPSLATVRNMLAGGDVLSPKHVERFLDAHRSAILINGYGPTEGTTFTCCHQLRYGDPIGKTVPIGRPISKTRVLMLDESSNQVSLGEVGELYIGGEGVARGYLNQSELTAERFVRNIYSTDSSDVMYRSGDLVRVRPDGVIEFVGRKDNQVKIRGFRVELGEVEVCLRRHPAVRHAVAIVVENGIADKAIHAFWTAKAGNIAASNEVLHAAGEHLPSYMLPASLTRLDSLPLTENGKVDRKRLLEIAQRNVSRETTYLPPSDPLEVELIEIWEEVLGVSRIGVRDDFFLLGGHSLLAARMFARVAERLHKNLPFAILFQGATIEKLAQVIRSEGWTPHWSVLVPIREHGSKPPLFLVHGLRGNVLTFYGLRQHMPADQPLYGVQANGLAAGRAVFVSILEMAEHYIKEIRSLQPVGPYFLGGFSAGGLVAYEMARQLHEAGECVQFLALFDSYVDVAGGYWLKSFYSRRALRMSLLALRATLHSIKAEGFILVLGKKLQNMGVNIRIMAWILLGKISGRTMGSESAQPNFLNPHEAFTRAIRVYSPRPYPGPAISFRSAGLGVETADFSEDWARFITGKLERQVIRGGHEDIFREPHIAGLAQQLTQALDASYRDHEEATKKNGST